MARPLHNWFARHQHPVSLALHAVGIPATVAAVVVAVLIGAGVAGLHWWLVVGLFVGGYALQFIGHAIEGNDAGEVILVKKLMGRSDYVAVVDRSDKDRHTRQ